MNPISRLAAAVAAGAVLGLAPPAGPAPAAPGAAAEAPAAALGPLIARTLAAYGGAALPGRGSLTRSEGRIVSLSQKAEGTILREVAWPDHLRIEIRYPGLPPETRELAGAQGWRDGRPAPAPLVAAMRLQAARLSLPMLLEWERAALTDLGPAVRGDGVAVRRLRVGLGEGLALFVEIAEADGRILRSAGVMEMGGAEMSFGAVYSAFSDFGGLSLPAREDQSAMGQPIGWTITERVETGLPLPPVRRPGP